MACPRKTATRTRSASDGKQRGNAGPRLRFGFVWTTGIRRNFSGTGHRCIMSRPSERVSPRPDRVTECSRSTRPESWGIDCRVARRSRTPVGRRAQKAIVVVGRFRINPTDRVLPPRMRDGLARNRTRAAAGRLSNARTVERTRGLRVAEFSGIRAYAWSSPERGNFGYSETGPGYPRIMIRSARTAAFLSLRSVRLSPEPLVSGGKNDLSTGSLYKGANLSIEGSRKGDLRFCAHLVSPGGGRLGKTIQSLWG